MSKAKIKQPLSKGVAKVPIVMQLEALECGAACLTMILEYYEKWIPLEQVRVDCGVSRDGSNAKNIIKAARHYGLMAYGFKLEPNELKEHGSFPCIVHWNFNHFVVVKGFRGGKAYINDPAGGDYSVSMEQFDESFTGICLQFAPDEEFLPEGEPKSVWAFTKKRITSVHNVLSYLVLSATVISFIGVITPVYGRVFLDYIIGGNNPKWFMPFMVSLAVIYGIQFIAVFLRSIANYRIGGKLSTIDNLEFMWKVLHLPMKFFSQRMTGDIMSRLIANTVVTDTLVYIIAPLAFNSIMMLFYLFIMMRFNVALAIIGLVSACINYYISGVVSRKKINITRVGARDEGKLYTQTISGIEMVDTIKASGAEYGYFEQWSGYQAKVNKSNVKFTKLDQSIGILPTLVVSTANILILGIGVYLAMIGEFSLGMVTAFQGFYQSFMSPAAALILTGDTIQETRTQMERIEDVLTYPDDVCFKNKAVKTDDYSKLSGNIELKNVTFGYSPLDEPLIKDFSFTIKPGQKIAIVGASGCGKSTLSKLLTGLYTPWSGSISFDGKKIYDINRDIFTSSVAVVDQNIILFEDTIANNIKMWDSSIEDFEMILAARDAQIHSDIVDLPNGYDYMLSEGGKNLSGGQCQRIEIARVLAQDPTVIILDEATSALDSKTEHDVINAIKDRGVTCIVIAHRLSTIRDCDCIIVLENGIVKEQGTHDELMAKGGLYKNLILNN